MIDGDVSVVISCDIKYLLSLVGDKRLKIGCNFFYLFRNQYDENGDISFCVFDAVDCIQKAGLFFVNCILSPLENKNNTFSDNVLYILWFTNCIDTYEVVKDNIREKSIWKDVEWGKREKNYNKKGKDPGNVWIPTNDDGCGNITNHIILGIEDIVKRIVCFASDNNKKVIINLNRKISITGYDCFFEITATPLSLEPFQYTYSAFPTNVENKPIFSDVFFESSEQMRHINDDTVKCMVTSPPYWDIKNYFKEGQIGQETYERYQTRITKVWKSTYSKLDGYGSAWINVNTIFKRKKLIPIPKDIIDNCREIGFHLKACVIWHKSSAIPTHSRNLCDHFEYVFVFTKTTKWYLDYNCQINDYCNPLLANGSFWNINRKAGIIGINYIHPAIFPLELIERIVSISTNESDYVLDPFLGSGTSLIAALNQNRSFVGYEYYEGFKELISYRIKNECKYKEKTAYHLDSKNGGPREKTIFRNK